MSLATRAPLRHPDRLFVDGRWVAPASPQSISVTDSATGEEYFRVAAAGPEDMRRAIAAARKAFDTGPWPRLSHAERGHYLRGFAAGLRKRSADIGQLWPR